MPRVPSSITRAQPAVRRAAVPDRANTRRCAVAQSTLRAAGRRSQQQARVLEYAARCATPCLNSCTYRTHTLAADATGLRDDRGLVSANDEPHAHAARHGFTDGRDQSPICFCMCSRRSCASSDSVAIGRASSRSSPISSSVSSQNPYVPSSMRRKPLSILAINLR